MEKERLDKLLVDRKLVETRAKAQALILAGKVIVNDKKIDQAGTKFSLDVDIRIKGENLKYVSRGALKLEKAIIDNNIIVEGLTCIDVGASTGGFSDFLLQNGAKKVYAVDVGYGQLAWKLQQDKRLINIERTNIRNMPFEKIGEKVDLIVIDVSFISLKIVLPTILKFLKNNALVFALIKPQFEVGKGEVDKGGIVKDEAKIKNLLLNLNNFFQSISLNLQNIIPSPILGAKGNQEFIAFLKWETNNDNRNSTI